jgi:hypothetical protein
MSRKGAFCNHWSSAFPLLALADGLTLSHEGWHAKTDPSLNLDLHLLEMP